MAGGYAVRRPVLNAYLVRERDRRRLRELALLILVLLPAAAGLMGYVRLHFEVLSTGYEVERLEAHLRQRERRERQLTLEAAHLASPAAIERRAVAELGMRRPSVDEIVFERELP